MQGGFSRWRIRLERRGELDLYQIQRLWDKKTYFLTDSTVRTDGLQDSWHPTSQACPVCSEAFRPGSRAWFYQCDACHFLASELPVAINTDLDRQVDEVEREKGLLSLRQANFVRILDRMESCLGGRYGSLLEVGCAHGWFLQAAKMRGYAVTGLEPDPQFREKADANGMQIITGYFPTGLSPGKTFDVIVFNDVFEHLPEPDAAMRGVAEHLNSGGAVVINIPNSQGFFYRTAMMLDAVGIQGPLRRMWQFNFPSPHLSYFNPAALARLAKKYNLSEVHRSSLATVTVDGLWQRLRHVQQLQPTNVVISAGVWLAVATLSPLISRLPSDASLMIFRKD